MPEKASLKEFLRRDLLSKRSRALVPYYDAYHASRKPKVNLKYEPTPDLPFPPRAGTPEDDAQSAHDLILSKHRDTDSLFGDILYTKEEIHQHKLEKLLADDQKRNDEDEPRQRSQNPELVKLMGELNALVSLELNTHGAEKLAIQGQKLALIKEIGKLEAKISIKKVKDLKGNLYRPMFRDLRCLSGRLGYHELADSCYSEKGRRSNASGADRCS